MIILLTLIVLGLTKVLWWLKDKFRKRPEAFTGIPVNAPVDTPEEAIQRAFVALPTSELQQQALATPIVEVPQIDAEYQRDQQAGIQAAESTESLFRQSVQGLFQIDPTRPLEEQTPSSTGARGATIEPSVSQEQTDAEFQALLTSLNQNAFDRCFQQSCTTIQANQDEKCRGFAEQCYYRLDRNIVQCLKSLDDRCSIAGLEACRDECQKKIEAWRYILREDEPLMENQWLTSLSGSTHFILRDTGHLELYYRGRQIWTNAARQPNITGTLSQGPYQLFIDPNGHMSIKNGFGMETWKTNTWADPLKSGSINAPYQLVVSEQRAALLNKDGAILWDSQTDS